MFLLNWHYGGSNLFRSRFKRLAVAIFIDLPKAFDTINNDFCFSTLKHYVLTIVELDWFRSYTYATDSNVLKLILFNHL